MKIAEIFTFYYYFYYFLPLMDEDDTFIWGLGETHRMTFGLIT